MKMNITKPDIVRVEYRPDRSDPDYTKSTWAFFDFDVDNWMMNIQSDAGNFAYSWCHSQESKSFLAFISKLDADYFIHKISRRSEIDLVRTKERLRDCLRDNGLDEDRIEEEMDDLDYRFEYLECINEYTVIDAIDSWNDEENLEIDDTFDYVAHDYPNDAKTITDIFMVIKEMIATMLADGGIEL